MFSNPPQHPDKRTATNTSPVNNDYVVNPLNNGGASGGASGMPAGGASTQAAPAAAKGKNKMKKK